MVCCLQTRSWTFCARSGSHFKRRARQKKPKKRIRLGKKTVEIAIDRRYISFSVEVSRADVADGAAGRLWKAQMVMSP